MEDVKKRTNSGGTVTPESGPPARDRAGRRHEGDERPADHQEPGGTGLPGTGRRPAGVAGPASARRDNLVRLAAEIFARKGFQATTVREIAKEAGILSGSLYHHFDSKESIVDEVLSRFLEDLLGRYRAAVAAGGEVRDVLAAMVRIGFESLEPHRAAITVMQNDWNYLRSLPGDRFDYLVAAEDEVERMWVDQIKRGQAEGRLRADVDPRLTYRMIRDTIFGSVRWFRPGDRLDVAALADQYVSLLFDGLATGGGTGGRVLSPSGARTGRTE
jgi:Transcriptional regulator